MTKSGMSLRDDLIELTSPTNIVFGLIIPILLAIIGNENNFLLNILFIIVAVLLISIIYLVFRWAFVYKKKERKSSPLILPVGANKKEEEPYKYIKEQLSKK